MLSAEPMPSAVMLHAFCSACVSMLSDVQQSQHSSPAAPTYLLPGPDSQLNVAPAPTAPSACLPSATFFHAYFLALAALMLLLHRRGRLPRDVVRRSCCRLFAAVLIASAPAATRASNAVIHMPQCIARYDFIIILVSNRPAVPPLQCTGGCCRQRALAV